MLSEDRQGEVKTETGVFKTEIYCENGDCNARESLVTTKNYGDSPEPRAWACPACGNKAKVHWRMTAEQWLRQELRNSIGEVNAALYQRDNDTSMVPIAAFIDTLPPEWRAIETRNCGETIGAA